MPCSEMHTDAFIQQARNVATEVGAKISIVQGEALLRKGFGGLWNVGKAATRMPALVVLT
jgi:probable aminopeptidase NPEPL1